MQWKKAILGVVILAITVGVMVLNGKEPGDPHHMGWYSVGFIVGMWMVFSPLRSALWGSSADDKDPWPRDDQWHN